MPKLAIKLTDEQRDFLIAQWNEGYAIPDIKQAFEDCFGPLDLKVSDIRNRLAAWRAAGHKINRRGQQYSGHHSDDRTATTTTRRYRHLHYFDHS